MGKTFKNNLKLKTGKLYPKNIKNNIVINIFDVILLKGS